MKTALRSERTLLGVALANTLLFVVFLSLAAADDTAILGLNRWFKPAKFAVSIAIYCYTLAWIVAPLGNSFLSVRLARLVVAVSMIGEIALIAMQSARGVPSHFNNSTPFDAFVFGAMGVLIMANTIAVAFVLRDYVFRPPYLHPAVISSIRAGLAIFLLGSLEATVMLAFLRHTVGASDGGPGLPFLNWSTQHGDLRAAHFFAIHALQGLPLIGLLLRNVTAVRTAAVLWLMGFVALLAWALAGRPLPLSTFM